MRIILDSNEYAHDDGLKTRLERALSAPVEVEQLFAGDLKVELDEYTTLLVERKRTPEDLVSSIADGRLFEQAERMVATAELSVIILEGILIYDYNGHVLNMYPTNVSEDPVWNRNRVEAALNRVTMLGAAVIRDINNYAETVATIVMECVEGKVPHRRPLTFNPNTPEVQRKLDWLVGSLPGIGGGRAQELMKLVGEDRPLVDYLTCALDDDTIPRLWGPRSKDKLKEFFLR